LRSSVWVSGSRQDTERFTEPSNERTVKQKPPNEKYEKRKKNTMKSQTIPETPEPGLRRVYASVLVCAMLLGLSAALVSSVGTGAQVLTGGVIGLANLWAIAQRVHGLLGGAMSVPWVLAVVTKVLALIGIVYVFVTVTPLSVMALALGYAALPFGIVAAQLAPRLLANTEV
jgi:hypothetical protein